MHLQEFDRLVQVMKRLRKECPWDREQTPESLRQYILEEAYETIEAIDAQDWKELKKELGDLLLQVVFQAEIAEEEGRFTLPEVIEHINNKLIQRHPHVFGDVKVKDAQEVKNNWEQIKVKSEQRKSILQGVPRNFSALLRAQRIQDKASQVGFDWENPGQVLEKIREEVEELQQSSAPEAIEEEIGDLLFSLVNLSRFYKVSAEDALRKTTNKFISRFEYIEQKLEERQQDIHQVTLQEMDRLWEEAKALQRDAAGASQALFAAPGGSLEEKMEQFSAEIANYLDLPRFWPFLAGFFKDAFAAGDFAAITPRFDIRPYQLDYLEGFAGKDIHSLVSEEHSPLIEKMETQRQVVNRADLPAESDLCKIMESRGIGLALPVSKQKELLAIILLGGAAQTLSPSRRQLHSLKLVSSQVAIALDNIRSIENMVQSRKMAGLGMLASQLAHDFRSFIALAKSLNKENERFAKHAGYMEKMVQDLLNYARPQDLKLAGVNINDLLDMSLELLHAPAEVHIEKHYAPQLPKLNLDITQMRRAFLNLLQNSLRALRTQPNGRIKITTKELRPLSRFRRNPWVYIEILDEGIGIPEEYLERIFDPFFTTHKNEGGNGLGLAIVKQTITRHSGFIDVASKPGKGTVFNIRLPLQMG